MELAIDKSGYLKFRGRDQQCKLMGKDLANCTTFKDLRIRVVADISWKEHIEDRMKKAYEILHILKRSVAV